MGTSISLAGVSYNIPSEGDGNYGEDVSAYLIALANNTKVFQASSANFPLQQETNFGTNYGLKVAYIKSQSANSSSTGILRLGNNEAVGWRNAGNSADLSLKVNASDVLEFNGTSISIGGTPVQTQVSVSDSSTIDFTLSSNDISGSVKAGSIDDSHISALASIAYSKLSLASSIVNADISPSASIAYSKLALTNSITNSDISASAAIALSKLAALTSSKALISDASGYVSASSVTSTELGHLSGVTSSVQTQLNSKEPTLMAGTTSQYYRGDKSWQTLDKAAVGLSNVDNTSDATKNSAAVVLTNKDIDGGTASNTSRITLPKAAKTTLDSLTRKQGSIVYDTTSNKPYYDDGTNLKVIGSGSGGAVNFITNPDASTGTTGWYTFNGVKAGTTVDSVDGISVPGGHDFPSTPSSVGRPIKILSLGGACGLTVGNTYYVTYYSSTVFNVSSTPGGANINITADVSITFAELRPVTASGTANITWTTSTTNPLAGDSSFIFTKDAADRQYQGVLSPFTIDNTYQAKVLNISFPYKVNSGTFVAGSSSTTSDLIVYLYDVTNNTVIEPSSFKLLSNSSTVSDVFSASFQTPYNSTSYRLIYCVATNSTAAWSLQIDNIAVSPAQYAAGANIEDTQSYTGSLTYAGTVATNITSQTYKRTKVGDRLFVSGTILFNGAANANGAFRIPLPPGVNIDTNKIASSYAKVGDAIGYFNSNKQFDGHIRIDGNSTTYVTIHRWDDSGAADQDWGGNTSGASNVPGGVAIANGDGISFQFSVPVLGWSSSVQASDGYDGRVIVASGNFSTTTISTTFSQLGLTTARDASAMVSGNSVVIQTDADYAIDMFLSANSASSSTTDQEAAIYVNGLSVKSSVVTSQYWHSNSVHYEARLKAGDIVTFYAGHGVVTATTSSTRNSWSVKRLAGNPVISATETICAFYELSGNVTAPTSAAILIPNVKVLDTHGIVNTSTGTVTIPSPGIFEISMKITGLPGNTTTSVVTGFITSSRGNSNTYIPANPGSNYGTSNVSLTTRFFAGDQINFNTGAGTVNGTVIGGAAQTQFSIKRIGI